MAGFENRAGFSIANSKLQIVEINYKYDQFVLENVDEAYFNESINFERDKETKISALLQGAFNELLVKKALKSTNVSFTLPFELFYTMQVPYDNTLLHHDLIEEFRWELSVLYPYAPYKEMVIQYIEVEKNIFIDFNTAFVVGIPRKYIQLIYNFVSQNNLKLKFIDNVHLASERALSLNNFLLTNGLVLSVYLSNKYLSLIFSSNGKPIYFKVIPLSDASEISAVLLNEIEQNKLLKIQRNLIDSAFISGDNISESLIQTISSILEIDFIHFNPFDKIDPDVKLLDNKCYSEKFNSFAPAAGIAYRLA